MGKQAVGKRRLGRGLRAIAVCGAAGITLLACSMSRPGAEYPPAYREPHRPQLHFSPPSMWMNDPNGLVYYAGEYHLYYQFYPGDKVWGPMHWGHAVSRDLIHWEHLPIALYPDPQGYIFSGSAVVDHHNRSGFGRDGEPPLVAMYTYHDSERAKTGSNDHESQAIAYSTDGGRTFTKYAGNPVIPNTAAERDFRDPNVFWYAPDQRWIAVISVHDKIQLWASPDLRNWSYLSDFGQQWGAHNGTWECPDLFPIRVQGSDQSKWVLLLNLNPGGPQGGSGTQYFVGDFDGQQFTLDPQFADTLRHQDAVWLDWGRDNYAGITWSDAPVADDERVFIGWMSNWDYAQEVPTSPWRSAMTLPRRLQLARLEQGFRIRSTPVPQLQTLRGQSTSIEAGELNGRRALTVPAAIDVAVSELHLQLQPQRARFGIELSNALGERYRLSYDPAENAFFSDRTAAGDHRFSEQFARVHRAPRLSSDSTVEMHLILDLASVELFADQGLTVLTDTYFPTAPFDRIELYSEGGSTQIISGQLTALRSIW